MLRTILAAFALLALAAPAPAQTVVPIKSKAAWKNTGIVVHAGDTVSIQATGKWRWSDGMAKVGPDGDPTDDYNAFDLYQPFDFFSQARLIAYIGDLPRQGHWGDSSFFPQESGYFSIGSGQVFVAPYSGKLWLGINDAAVTQSNDDNLGTVTATITLNDASATAPTVAIVAPGGVYAQNQSVAVHYSCGGATAIASCVGPVADGGALDTSTAGHFAFDVVATDTHGDVTAQGSSYVVVDAGSAAVWPTGGAFETVAVGAKSTWHLFYLINPGDGAMDLGSIATQGDFAIQGTTCGASLGAHKTCRIAILSKPALEGTSRGELDIAGSLNVAPVPLWGYGTLVHAAPAALSFPETAQGNVSAPLTVRLTNGRGVAEPIREIVIGGDFARDASSTCVAGTRLKPGGSCNIAVTFAPTGSGTRTGSLVVHGQSVEDPASISLSGTSP
ncbi:MAG: choice-of-anchor D domain-containing protein [Alphaproteobacteria bacterium]|nr:choice-of-anchor D domain-containing protein [Alphaproteobacteria bacterium]